MRFASQNARIEASFLLWTERPSTETKWLHLWISLIHFIAFTKDDKVVIVFFFFSSVRPSFYCLYFPVSCTSSAVFLSQNFWLVLFNFNFAIFEFPGIDKKGGDVESHLSWTCECKHSELCLKCKLVNYFCRLASKFMGSIVSKNGRFTSCNL